MDNANSQDYLEKIKVQVIENLKRTTFAPSVQMTDVPRDPEDDVDNILDDLDEDEHKDQRYPKRTWDKYVEKEGELSESEDEEENESNGVRRQPGGRKRRNIMDYQNADVTMDEDDLGSGVGSPRRGRSRERDELGVRPDVEDNGSARSSNVNREGSAATSEAGFADDASPHPDANNLDDEDVDMADDPVTLPPVNAQPSADGPQEATPPDSPPTSATAQGIPEPATDHPSNDPMDEGDTLDDPDLEKDEGQEEREAVDIAGEKSTEVAENT